VAETRFDQPTSGDPANAPLAHLALRLLDVSPVGIMLIDYLAPNTPIVYINAGFTRLTGYAAADALGHNGDLLYGPETDAAVITRVRQAIQRHEPCTVALLAYRKDGSRCWTNLVGVPLQSKGGEVAHYVAAYTDISALKQSEHQLQQAQKVHAIGLLAGGIAHDFKNILTIIQGHCELLLRRPLPAFEREQVAQLLEASERGAALARHLLMFSRNEEIKPVVLDLNAAVGRMKIMLARLIGDDILVRIQLAPQPPHIKIDLAQLEQVLMNLAVNARDAMPQGGIFTVRIQPVTLPTGTRTSLPANYQPGPYVEISVADTGGGMDEATRAQIFEPFFTTKPAGKGTGLGLSTVYAIISQNGGFIEVESEIGRGTVFHLWLPQTNAPALSPPPVVATTLTPMPVQAAAILIVEDDDQIRTLTTFILEERGYTVLAATGLHEAVYLVESTATPLDLLVTDLRMPGGSGLELYTRLITRYPTLKVLFMSGYSEHEISQQQAVVKNHFLSKPFTLDTLVSKVHEILATP